MVNSCLGSRGRERKLPAHKARVELTSGQEHEGEEQPHIGTYTSVGKNGAKLLQENLLDEDMTQDDQDGLSAFTDTAADARPKQNKTGNGYLRSRDVLVSEPGISSLRTLLLCKSPISFPPYSIKNLSMNFKITA